VNTQIQKIGRWTGDLLEYIRNKLAEFSMGMSHAMKKSLGYMVVSGGAFHSLPEDLANLSIGIQVSLPVHLANDSVFPLHTEDTLEWQITQVNHIGHAFNETRVPLFAWLCNNVVSPCQGNGAGQVISRDGETLGHECKDTSNICDAAESEWAAPA
jgi:hypothetical protein